MKKLFALLLLALIAVSCSTNNAGNMNSKTAMKIEKLRRFYDEVMNAHNPALIDSFCTADFIDHQQDPHYPAGIEGLRAAFKDFFTGFPDLHVTPNFIISQGDSIVAQFTMTGTNSGPMMGMPATNKQVHIDGVDVLIINDDLKASEHWGYSEEMKMMTQLGMMGNPSDSTKK